MGSASDLNRQKIISEFEDRSFEIIESEEQKQNQSLSWELM